MQMGMPIYFHPPLFRDPAIGRVGLHRPKTRHPKNPRSNYKQREHGIQALVKSKRSFCPPFGKKGALHERARAATLKGW
jgi:hypothetical protein